MHFSASLWFAALTALMLSGAAASADDLERPPIEYSRTSADNCLSRLQSRLDRGEAKLKYTDKLGYLPAILQALDVPVESQMLVFSMTSLQRDRISPSTPRAIYFNDEVYVGYCQTGEVLEVSAVDPNWGRHFTRSCKNQRIGCNSSDKRKVASFAIVPRAPRAYRVTRFGRCLSTPEDNRSFPPAVRPSTIRRRWRNVGAAGTSPANMANKPTWAT
jgi:hypothetical protein